MRYQRSPVSLLESAATTWRGLIVLHTSGALDSTVLSWLKSRGAAVGSMHLLRSFSGVGTPPLEEEFLELKVMNRQYASPAVSRGP
jgi:predicted short-subunit dehydrogenase-like oxidoreductase (DUF2520 family)